MTSTATKWMLYGAAGHTGSLIARHAVEHGHRPVLAGRTASSVATLAASLDLPQRAVGLDDPAALREALDDVDLVLNAAGPFLHTAVPLAEACLDAGVHYLDISNELRVFRALYDRDERARQAGVTLMPGVGFGVVATNGLALAVSDAVGGATRIEVATRIASMDAGPGAAATVEENLPYGGWIREEGELRPLELGQGMSTIDLPDGTFAAMPVPTGDLEAAFRATGAPDVTAYMVLVDPEAAADLDRSYGWARATGREGATAAAWLEIGDSYGFTAAASVRAAEETLGGSATGALSPAAAFGPDFALGIAGATRG